MKQVLIILAFISSGALFLSGCDVWPFCGAEDTTISEDREIPEFIKINLAEDDTYINMAQKEEHYCNVTGPKNTLSNLTANVVNGALIIDAVSCVSKHKKINIEMHCRRLNEVEVSGDGAFSMTSPLIVEDISLFITGDGKISIEDLSANSIRAVVSGSGDINLGSRGKIKYLEIEISGNGNVNAYNLPVENISVKISGSGSCRINPLSGLNASISGSGNIYYRGEPVKTVNITGDGAVYDKN